MNPLTYPILISTLVIAVVLLVMVFKLSNNKASENLVLSTISALPTPVITNSNTEVLDLQYPSSQKKAVIDDDTIFESYDSPFEITNWYQNKIKESGLKVTSFIQTTTNGDVLNKIVSISSERKIGIEISKTAQDLLTRITVSGKINE